jgi:hypothetical protein
MFTYHIFESCILPSVIVILEVGRQNIWNFPATWSFLTHDLFDEVLLDVRPGSLVFSSRNVLDLLLPVEAEAISAETSFFLERDLVILVVSAVSVAAGNAFCLGK